MSALEVRYGSDRHTELLSAIKERLNLSKKKVEERLDAWKEADDVFKAYVKATEEEKLRASKRKQGEPQFTTLYVPYSYALLLSVHTYWASVFLSRNPVFQLTGRHGETQMQVHAMEALIDYQVQVGEMLPHLYVWLMDTGRYGYGVLGNFWSEEKVRVSRIVERPATFAGIPIVGKTRRVKETAEVDGYKGNKVFNVRPVDFYPDPRVSLANFQQGEFCGHRSVVGWNTILKRRAEGRYFNIDRLREVVRKRKGGAKTSSLGDVPEQDTLALKNDAGYVNIIELAVELVPSEKPWKVGASSYPEKWFFTVGEDEVIIGIEPLGALHNKFPYFVMLNEIEGHGLGSRGLLEIVKPLNDAMTWLFNQHFYNVRKAINDQLVVDPARVVVKDLLEGGPGRLIRVRPEAAGQPVRDAIFQLPVMDVTARHLSDAQIVAELMQRVVGASDNFMGVQNPRGRKTATEVRTASSYALSRQKTFTEFNSAIGWSRLSSVMVQNTQEHYDEEQVFRIAGSLAEAAQPYAKVTMEDIQGFFDFIPVDGTMPIDRFAQAQLWKEILEGLGQTPAIAMAYDVPRMFAWMAQLAGIKNLDQFKLEPRPDAQVAQQVQEGNLLPLGGAA